MRANQRKPLLMTKRLNLTIPDDFYNEIIAHKPLHQTVPTFCVQLIAEAIDTRFRLATCPAGAGRTKQPDSVELKPSVVQSGLVSVQENFVTPLGSHLGEGVGKGSGETPRKPPCKREIPSDLQQHEELIREFWRIKGGSKSDTAWKMLLTELGKILSSYSHQKVSEQLMLAINGKWKGVTLANLSRFESVGSKQPQEPPTRHPASRVFTADKGFLDL